MNAEGGRHGHASEPDEAGSSRHQEGSRERAAPDQRESGLAEEDGAEVDLANDQHDLDEAHHLLDEFVETVRLLHNTIINQSGGVLGERHGSLVAICARPHTWATAHGNVATFLERAALLFHGIICGHAFADGNKRTGTILACAIIELEPWVGEVTSEQLIQMESVALDAAQPGGLSMETIIARFRIIFPEPRTDSEPT